VATEESAQQVMVSSHSPVSDIFPMPQPNFLIPALGRPGSSSGLIGDPLASLIERHTTGVAGC